MSGLSSRTAGQLGTRLKDDALLMFGQSLSAREYRRRDQCRAMTLALKMTVLLRPQLPIDRAAFEQHAMRAQSRRPCPAPSPGSESHSTRLAKRCETMTMVRPCAMRCRLALTTASLCGSSALVASSRIKMRGSWIKARAIASRCLCPPERLGEPFFDVGLVAVRHALDEFLGTGKPRRIHRIRKRQAGTSGDDVVADRCRGTEIVLQHHTEALPQMPKIDLAQIGAVDFYEAAIVAIDPLQQAGDRGLARAAAADDAEHGALRERKS